MAYPGPPEIETERLRLREFRAGDLDDYLGCVGDPDVMKYIGLGETMTREDAWRSMAALSGHWNLRGYGLWAVEEKSTGRVVGRVGYHFPEGWPGEEIGWLLRRDVWGRGYATEAVRAAMARGRALLGLDRVIAIIQPENAASVRLVLRLGGSLDHRIELRGRQADVYVVPLPPAAPGGASDRGKGGSMNESGETTPASSTAAGEALRTIEGRWTVRGMEDSFTEVCEFFPGGHHMVCYATSQLADATSRHMSVITWFAEERCFLYFGVGSSGSVKRYRGTYENGVWGFTGSASIENAAASVRISMTPIRDGFRFLEEYSFDGLAWTTESDLDYVRLPEEA